MWRIGRKGWGAKPKFETAMTNFEGMIKNNIIHFAIRTHLLFKKNIVLLYLMQSLETFAKN